MTRNRVLLLTLLGALTLFGCDEPEADEPTPTVGASGGPARLQDWVPSEGAEGAAPSQEGHPDPATGPFAGPDAPTPPNAMPGVRGTVRETMVAAGYDYMRVETEEGMIWVAAMNASVDVGDEVEATGVMMNNFRSNALDRTFATIVLASRVQVLGPDGQPAGGAGGGAPGALPPGHPMPGGHPTPGGGAAAPGGGAPGGGAPPGHGGFVHP